MNRIQKLKISAITLQVIGVLVIIMGIAFITLRPIVVLLPEDVRYTGLSPDQLKAFSPHLFSWIGMVFRSWGAFDIGFGILVIGLVRNAYQNRERWAWWTLVAAGVTTFTGFLVVNVLLGSDFKWVIAVLYICYALALWLGKPSKQDK